MRGKIVVICGATASGKSAYAISQAQKHNGVIINADAMQVYQGLAILTAQPTSKDLDLVPHKLYGFLKVDRKFSLAKWVELALVEIKDALNAGKVPILVGGTGLYLKSLIEGYAYIPEIQPEIKQRVLALEDMFTSPELHMRLKSIDKITHNRLNPNDTKRILRAMAVYYQTNKPISWWQEHYHSKFFNRKDFYIIWLAPPREKIYQNCNTRFHKMLEDGVIGEVKSLLLNYPNISYPKVIGLAEIIDYISGQLSLDEMTIRTQQLTRNYAKRQNTWFKNQITPDNIIFNP